MRRAAGTTPSRVRDPRHATHHCHLRAGSHRTPETCHPLALKSTHINRHFASPALPEPVPLPFPGAGTPDASARSRPEAKRVSKTILQNQYVVLSRDSGAWATEDKAAGASFIAPPPASTCRLPVGTSHGRSRVSRSHFRLSSPPLCRPIPLSIRSSRCCAATKQPFRHHVSPCIRRCVPARHVATSVRVARAPSP